MLVLCPLVAQAQNVAVRGFVTDATDGQPLQGANVVLTNAAGEITGSVANKDGFYQVGGLAPGLYTLRISFIGYEAYTDALSLGGQAFVTVSVELGPAAELLEEVVVAAESGAARVQAGLQTVRPADLARIPTPDAGGDLATYLQTLPGVVSLGDRGGQLYVRGGTPAQNLVLIDGLTVYQPFHIVGFFSAFPEDLVSHVDVYAGGFGAKYSGRISSVIDVTTREGNKQFFEGAASLSPFLTSLRVEGPLRKGEVSMLASVRRSVIERIGPGLLGQDLPLRFGDLFFKVQQTDGQNNRCSATLLHTYDRGRIDPDDDVRDDVFRWNNFVVGGRCLAFPSESPVLFDAHTGLSYVRNEVGSSANPERSSTSLQLNTDLNLKRLLVRGELDFGLFVRMNWLGFSLEEQFQNAQADEGILFSLGGYFQPTYRWSDRLSLSPGVALVFYPSSYPLSIEPRLRMVFRPGGDGGAQEWSAALGLYRQTLAGISDERDAGSSFIAWLPAPVEDTQAQAFHALLGWQVELSSSWTFAVEGYYKDLRDLVIPIWSTVARFTTELDLADGEAYGVDVRLELQRPTFYGYISYGYAQTEYTSQQDNFGAWFGDPIQSYNPPHDRRHQINVVLSQEIGAFTANVRWQLGTGLPFTEALGFDEFFRIQPISNVRESLGTTRVLYDRPYKARIPDYHRLDVSVARTFDFQRGSTLTLQGGAINVYDRRNLFYFDLFTVRRVDQLPFLPNLSAKLEF